MQLAEVCILEITFLLHVMQLLPILPIVRQEYVLTLEHANLKDFNVVLEHAFFILYKRRSGVEIAFVTSPMSFHSLSLSVPTDLYVGT